MAKNNGSNMMTVLVVVSLLVVVLGVIGFSSGLLGESVSGNVVQLSSHGGGGQPPKECTDGADNDGDGLVDYPLDLGCINNGDKDESNCGDGVCEGGETTDGCTEDCAMGCGNGVCEIGEDCEVCPSDCVIGAYCGDGVCQPLAGENCLDCAFDCNGKQNGNPINRFCCGNGEGQNPVSCGDPRCTQDGFQCDGDIPGEAQCCGDGVCLPPESGQSCSQDCI